jgi:hypothetical protein
MSLDGYYEGPGENVMALFDYRLEAYPMDESFDAYNAERLHAATMLLLGRTSYAGKCAGRRPSPASAPSTPVLSERTSPF